MLFFSIVSFTSDSDFEEKDVVNKMKKNNKNKVLALRMLKAHNVEGRKKNLRITRYLFTYSHSFVMYVSICLN